MTEFSFYKKAISYLAELNKGTQDRLVKGGWLINDEVIRIKKVLEKLALIENIAGETYVTGKGLNILLYYKMGKISDENPDETLQLLLNSF